jgi:surfactin synthase thioesterase subunit
MSTMDTTIVCLPPSGAGRSYFRAWPRTIGSARVLPLSRPGHEERMREPLASSLVAAADDVVARLGGRRTVLFGHSLGAIVAFEATRRWTGDPPVALVVSARQAPGLPSRAPAPDLDDDALLAVLRAWGGPADGSVAGMLLPALRADLALSAAYRWDGGATAAPVTAISYTDDRVVDAAAVRAWAGATTAGCRAVTLDGDHDSARSAPPSLIAVLEGVLDSVIGE